MNKIFDKLTPAFLLQFDTYLLENYPIVWRTRAHYVLLYTFILGLFSFLSGYLYPLDMCTIGRNFDKIKNISQLSFYLSLTLAICGVIYWWRQIIKHFSKNTSWFHALTEMLIYAFCLFFIWICVNIFSFGLNVNIADLKNNIKAEDRARLEENLFYAPTGYFYNYDDDINIDSLRQYEKKYLYTYIEKAKNTPYLDSLTIKPKENSTGGFYFCEFSEKDTSLIYYNVLKKLKRLKKEAGYNNYIHGRSYYNYEEDEIKKLFQKEDKQKPIDKSLIKLTMDSLKRSSDSIFDFKFKEFMLESTNYENFSLAKAIERISSKTKLKIIDTCNQRFFRMSNGYPFQDLERKRNSFEDEVLKKRFMASLSKQEKEHYYNYLFKLILLNTCNFWKFSFNRSFYDNDEYYYYAYETEAFLYFLQDEAFKNFQKQLDTESLKRYLDYLKFLNKPLANFRPESLKELTDNIKNRLYNIRQKNDYVKREYFPTRQGLDSIYKIAWEFLDTAKYANRDTLIVIKIIENSWDKILPFVPKTILENRNRSYYYNYQNKLFRLDTARQVYIEYYYKWKKKGQTLEDYNVNNYFALANSPDKEDKIIYQKFLENTIKDSVKYTFDAYFRKSVREMFFELNQNDSFAIKYNIKIKQAFPDADSAFLANVMQANGFMDDKSYTFDRSFLLSNAYYFLLANVQTYQAENFKKNYFSYYYIGDVKKRLLVFSLIVLLALFMFLSTSMPTSNIFIPIFISFFTVYFCFSIFKLVNIFKDQIQDNTSTYSAMGIIAFCTGICALHIFLQKYKSMLIHTLIQVQMISLIGIVLWVLKDDKGIQDYHLFMKYILSAFFVLMLVYRQHLNKPLRN